MHAHPSFVIEPLESRIAPAVILVGAPDTQEEDTNYNEAPFGNTEGSKFSNAGIGVAGIADTFYLQLSKGDILKVFNQGSGFEPFLIVKTGNVIAFFQDGQGVGKNEVSPDEFVGLSMGKNASVEIRGSIFGDVVTNLDEHGTKTTSDDTIDMTHLISQKQGIKGFVVGANVNGNIFSGGNVGNVKIEGQAQGIFAGTAANGRTFDFFPDAVTTLDVTAAVGVAGPSISKVRADSFTTGIYAGGGGAGAKGGNISSVQILSDTDGFHLEAGAGGANGSGKNNGGAGGSISKVFVSGVADSTDNSNNGMEFFGGAGGAGSATGKGGAGGQVSNILVGFEVNGVKVTASADTLHDSVHIQAGAGGAGKTGGVGGGVKTLDVNLVTPDSTTQPANNEISILAGAGGASLAAGGKTGNGGSITGNRLRNQEGVGGSDLLIQAGAAGATFAGSKSGAGGSIKTATVLASEAVVQAGNGSNGTTGGIGGSITGLNFLATEQTLLNALTLNGGTGGVGTAGAGGRGGNISTVKVAGADFQFVTVNGNVSGNGGEGQTKGGAGGAVSKITLVDIDDNNGFSGAFNLRSGAGGLGKTGGGAGGNIATVSLTAIDLQPTITAGSGGASSASGKGGKGGSIATTDISAVGALNAGMNPVSGSLTAGSGGAGTGGTASGGAGGGVATVNLNVLQSVTVLAGAGGNTVGTGNVGPGAGGSILKSAAFARLGSGMIMAGNAGTGGTKTANGGSITGTVGLVSGLRASLDVIVGAGSGSNGGSGGSIVNFAFGSTADSLTPTPGGNISVIAGNGSAGTKTAGAGGRIFNVDGSPSSGNGLSTTIRAGDGGGSATGPKSGAGGAVQALTLSGFGADDGLANPNRITIEAGNAGVSPAAKVGAKGGSVTGISVSGLDVDATLQRVAAGDGAAGTVKGGAGGSISQVQVLDHDIGVRSGAAYGYNTMGGVFAGAGGAAGKAGLAGGVNGVSANGIAAIVAGRGASPQLAGTVQNIVLNGQDILLFQEQDLVPQDDGGFANYRAYAAAKYATNNLVGFVQDPSRVDANKFSFTNVNGNVDDDGQPIFDPGIDIPQDGLIAATVYKSGNATFTPEFIIVGTLSYDFDNKI